MEQLEKTGGQIAIRKFGIRQFSTLNCFCGRHDASIFSDIENVPLVFSPRQLALLHYRAVAAELYKKIRMDEANGHHLASFREKPRTRENNDRIELLEAFVKGTRLGLRDARLALDECESILKNEDYARLSACVVRYKKLPTIMAVGGFYPEFDFDGRPLQALPVSSDRAETLSFNILASEGRAAVAIIWLKEDSSCLKFARSYSNQRSDHLTTLAIQTAFEHLENTCVNPDWWENLKPVEQGVLARRMHVAGGIVDGRSSSSLQYAGITHDDWEFDKIEFINVDKI